MRLDRALDRFDGDLARRNCSPRSRRDYFWHLRRLFDHLPPEDPSTVDLTQDVIRDCLDEWSDATPSTRYKVDAIFRSFCKWLYFNDLVERNPMDKLPRPKRTHPDDVPLRALSGSDVRKLFDACETWRELLCLSTLAYFGSRRGAVSRLRRRHLDLDRGWITFYEKGAKVIDKPIPHAYLEIVREAIAHGVIGDDPDAYVIPMLRAQRRKGDRDDRVIWRLVKTIGRRVGIETHPHALRHAFSVRFLEQHPGEIEALQRLLGHSKIETTQRYWRAMERKRLMERVRDLTWETRFESIAVEAPSGLEPLYLSNRPFAGSLPGPSHRHVPNGHLARVPGLRHRDGGAGRVGEIRRVTEFETPPGPTSQADDRAPRARPRAAPHARVSDGRPPLAGDREARHRRVPLARPTAQGGRVVPATT